MVIVQLQIHFPTDGSDGRLDLFLLPREDANDQERDWAKQTEKILVSLIKQSFEKAGVGELYEHIEISEARAGAPHPLTAQVCAAFEAQGKIYPSPESGLLFTQTELAEAIEVWLSQGNWKRNNPADKPAWSAGDFAAELGDVIFMAIITGVVAGVDPVQAMLDKIERKANDQPREYFPT